MALAAALGLAAAVGQVVPAAAQLTSQPTTLLTSVKAIDVQRHLAVFPVHRGVANGRTVWYVLTDVSDEKTAKSRGLIFAPAIANVGTTQTLTLRNSTWHFAGAPEFSSGRVFKPGPAGFPPSEAAPGAKAEGTYSPFGRLADRVQRSDRRRRRRTLRRRSA